MLTHAQIYLETSRGSHMRRFIWKSLELTHAQIYLESLVLTHTRIYLVTSWAHTYSDVSWLRRNCRYIIANNQLLMAKFWYLLPGLTFLLNPRGFHRTMAMCTTCQQRTLTKKTPGPVPFGNLRMFVCWYQHLQTLLCFRTLNFEYLSVLLFSFSLLVTLIMVLFIISVQRRKRLLLHKP